MEWLELVMYPFAAFILLWSLWIKTHPIKEPIY